MANMMDYINWRGDLEFSQVPLCEVDNLILSALCYIDFENIISPSFNKTILFNTAARNYLKQHRGEKAYLGAIVPPQIVALMARAAKSKRFGKLRVCGYINHISDDEQTQFCAMTYLLDDSHIFVAYRGTDDTIIGWKENFNMSFMHPVPAQLEAVSYLQQVAEERKEQIYVGGHSKGGNLAVYSLVKSSPAVKERVINAFNNDGPGFTREFIDSIDYENTRGKIRTIIPQSSVVGMLLEHEESYEVIKSSQNGLLQHDSLSWEVMGGSFIHLDTITEESKFIDRTLKQWLGEMNAEERETFVTNLFDALTSTNAKTLTELNVDRKKLRQAWNGLDSETRNTVFKCVKLLIKEKTKNILPKKEKAQEPKQCGKLQESFSDKAPLLPKNTPQTDT